MTGTRDGQAAALSAEDRLDILDLCARYSWTADTGDIAGWLDTFAADGEIQTGARSVRGRDAIAAWAKGRGRSAGERPEGASSRHWTNNHVIHVESGAVRHRCFWLGVVFTDTEVRVAAHGTYDDEVVKVDGAWRFRRRRITGDAPAPPGQSS